MCGGGEGALGRETSSTATLYLDRVNVGCGPAEERVLLTGLHAVADIYCENCKTTLGWKYVSTWTWEGRWPSNTAGSQGTWLRGEREYIKSPEFCSQNGIKQVVEKATRFSG